MVDVVVEREFANAITGEDFNTIALEGMDCFATYRANWHESLLSDEGKNLLCCFAAPDLETIRMLTEDVGVVRRRLWATTIHDTGKQGTPNVVVERQFDEPVAMEELQAVEDAGAWCLDLHNVTFLRSYFSTDKKRMICLYKAPDAESVRLAQRQANMPFTRVWSGRRFSPRDYPGE